MNDYNKAIAYFDEWLDCYYDIDDFPPDMTPEIASIALVTLKARQRQQEQPNEPLTLEELRQMELHQWIWIKVLQPFNCRDKVSAYYKKYRDYTHGKAFVCGYPGVTFGFDYVDYGKTWLAYRRKPEQEG